MNIHRHGLLLLATALVWAGVWASGRDTEPTVSPDMSHIARLEASISRIEVEHEDIKEGVEEVARRRESRLVRQHNEQQTIAARLQKEIDKLRRELEDAVAARQQDAKVAGNVIADLDRKTAEDREQLESLSRSLEKSKEREAALHAEIERSRRDRSKKTVATPQVRTQPVAPQQQYYLQSPQVRFQMPMRVIPNCSGST